MPLRDDLLNPIPGDNPSGANLRYDPVTDKIKEARREDLDVPQGDWVTTIKTADWPQVIKLSSDVLAKRSKDLQIAVWLLDAIVHKEGFAVLAPGFYFLRDFLEQFWDSLYPPVDEDGDMEVRSAPLVWLGAKLGEPLGFLPIVSGKLSWHKYQESRTVGYERDADTSLKVQAREAAISEGKVSAEQFDEAIENTSVSQIKDTYKLLIDARTALDSLAEYCDTQFGDSSPSFIKTRDAIEEITQTLRIIAGRKPGGIEELDRDEVAESLSEEGGVDFGSAEDSSSTAAETSMDFADSSSDEPAAEDTGVPGDLSGVAKHLAAICKMMRAQDPDNPAPYMILRSFAWARIMGQAPMIDRSAIEAPSSDLRMRLKRLTAEGEWDQVLELTESSMLQPVGLFWLDLQRYTMNALENKGLSGASRVVTNQLRVLLEMAPDVREFTLPDDTPAGNAETQNWIENFVIHQKVPRTEPKPAEESPSDSFSFDDSSSSLDTSFDMSSSDTSTDTSLDTSLDTSSWDTSSTDSTTDTSSEPAPEPEPEPYEVEANPPILEAEEPPPCDTSDEFGMALQAVRDGRVPEGLAIITSILATERSGRARFRRRTQLAHLLMAAGKGKVAQPLLDQLASEIEDRKLEEWEPGEAIAYPLELLMHCLNSADGERRAQLYTRICRLDPVRAVNCG